MAPRHPIGINYALDRIGSRTIVRFIGIDVSAARPCALLALDSDGRWLTAKWAEPTTRSVVSAIHNLRADDPAAVIAIDSPRMPLNRRRKWYWNGPSSSWRPRRSAEKGHGRHCEVAIAVLRLATPQWTPLASAAPRWMRFGFELFRALKEEFVVYEVFPSAAYTQLAGSPLRIELGFHGFATGQKDMLDAAVAALTVLEFEGGRGSEVGGGDQLGCIVLPRPLSSPSHPVLAWPRNAV